MRLRYSLLILAVVVLYDLFPIRVRAEQLEAGQPQAVQAQALPEFKIIQALENLVIQIDEVKLFITTSEVKIFENGKFETLPSSFNYVIDLKAAAMSSGAAVRNFDPQEAAMVARNVTTLSEHLADRLSQVSAEKKLKMVSYNLSDQGMKVRITAKDENGVEQLIRVDLRSSSTSFGEEKPNTFNKDLANFTLWNVHLVSRYSVDAVSWWLSLNEKEKAVTNRASRDE